MQLANAEEEGGAGKGGPDNEGLSTPDILNKLYQDVEKDFQVRCLFIHSFSVGGGVR